MTAVLIIHGRFEEFEGEAAEIAEHLSKARIHRRLVKMVDPHGFEAFIDPWAVSMVKQGETPERIPRVRGRHLESVAPDEPEEGAEGAALHVCAQHGPYDLVCSECPEDANPDAAKSHGTD